MSEQLYVVEMEAKGGYRFWSKPMPASEVDAYIENEESWGCSYSDTDTYHPLEV